MRRSQVTEEVKQPPNKVPNSDKISEELKPLRLQISWCHMNLIVVLYRVLTCRKVPVLGKHTKRIKCGCWSKQSLLALASDDHLLSVSNSDGDTVRQFNLQGDPTDIQFSEMKADERSNIGENTVSSGGNAGVVAAAALLWHL